jgi:hypothetical protein
MGVMVRYRDANNYYVARANALEDNVNLYKVQDGRRTEIAGKKIKVTGGQWHTLGLRAVGTKLQVFFDNEQVVQASDETFKEAGKAGLWTKADSVTEFDSVRITNLESRRD